MGSPATPTVPARTAADGGRGPRLLRAERTIALVRVAVVAVVAAIYVSSFGISRAPEPLALGLLALAALYGLWSLLALPAAGEAPLRMRLVTLLADVALITLWVQATGGPASEFWTLYLLPVVSVALRFELRETLGVALGLSVLHVAVSYAGGGLSRVQLVYRPALMLLTGFAVGVLAYQRALHRSERRALECLARERTQELAAERGEVERLRRIDLARSEFVVVAAHEFRTPLSAIIGALSILKVHGPELDVVVREELLDGATAQAERLARLVEDLLTVSRLEDGVLRLTLEPVEVRELVAEATRAAGVNGRVHVELHRVGPVRCDADAVIRVLTNLLDNAKKYSPEGSRIVVSVSQEDGWVRFAVRDAGRGIDPAHREEIFQRFRRLDGSDKPGTGLGLYISRGLVEAHGGTITVGDAPEGGAEFSFTLPRAGADAARSSSSRRRVPVTQVTAPVGRTR